MSLNFRCLLALGCLVLGGWVHGTLSGRWKPQEALTEAVARVERVPMKVGDWQAATLKADETEFAQARAKSYWMRTYTHDRTGVSLLVILMCGRAGHMSLHTPEICYQGAGYTMLASPETLAIPACPPCQPASPPRERGEDAFWTARFRKQGDSRGQMRLCWGWNAHGSWQALSNPRWQTQGEPFLYKMYVSCESTSADTQPAQEFLRDLLPALQQALFGE